MSKSTSVKLKDGYSERLKALAESKQRSSNWLLNEAVSRYLDSEEARAALLIEMREAHEGYVRGGRLHLTQEEVRDWMERRRTDRNAPMPKLHR
jgi:predicted transcriptional regulator